MQFGPLIHGLPGARARCCARTLKWLLVACLLGASQTAVALGLGEITVRSYLGQPLVARIELLSSHPEELDDLTAGLASADMFRRVGLDRMSLSVPLEFEVHRAAAGPFIEVRSRLAVNDPVLQFVLEVGFPNGRLLRQYTLFLDPPTYPAPVPLPDIGSSKREQPTATPSRGSRERDAAAAVASEPQEEAAPEPGLPVAARPETTDRADGEDAAADEVTGEDEAVPAEPTQDAPRPQAGTEMAEAAEAEPSPAEAEPSPAEPEPSMREDPPAESAVGSEAATEEPGGEGRLVAGDDSQAEPEPSADVETTEDEPGAVSEEAVEESDAGTSRADETAPGVDRAPEQSEAAPDASEEGDGGQAPEDERAVVAEAAADSDPAARDEAPDERPGASNGSRPRFQATTEQLERYGPVERGETLWKIASEIVSGTDLSINQAMLAIQRYNPEAFSRNNINLLKRGAILRLPPVPEMLRLEAREAMLEAMRQADDLQAIRAGLNPQPRPAPVLADMVSAEPTASVDEISPAVPDEPEGRLELVPPLAANDPDAAGSGEGEEEGSALLASEEDLANAEQESAYLNERLRELEGQLGADEPEARADVADTGMAELEQRLRQEREEGGEPEPVAITPPDDVGERRAARGWLLLLPLFLAVALVAWWLRRRGRASSVESGLESAVSGNNTAATAHSIAGEAEEILRVLDEADEPTGERAERTDMPEGHSGDREDPGATTRVVDLAPGAGEGKNDENDGGPSGEPPGSAKAGAPVSAADGGETPDAVEPQAGADEQRSPGQVSSSGEPTPRAGEEAVELDADDPETKLDLARAYIAMGDAGAARKLLEEVIGNGNDAQVAEARAMMEEV